MFASVLRSFESLRKIQPHSITTTLFVSAFCSVLILIVQPPIAYSPSVYEQNILWECLFIGGSTSINCIHVDPVISAPILPLLSGILSLALPPVIAIGVLIWIFHIWTIGLIWSFGSSCNKFWGGFFAVILYVSIAIKTNIISYISPEITITPFVVMTLLFMMNQRQQHSIKTIPAPSRT